MQTTLRSLILLLVLTLAASVAPADDPDTTPGVDLGKTRSLLESWTHRTTFPDSVTFAYYLADSLRMLEGGVPAEARDRIINFIRRCQRPNGGFVSNPAFGDAPNVVYTYYALAALDVVDAGYAVDRDKALGFIRRLTDPEGGIRSTPGDKARPSLGSTFYGVEALRLIKGVEVLDTDKTTAFILAHRTGDEGGFGVTAKGVARPRPTSMAVRTLATLGTLSEELRAQAIGYLETAIALVGTKGPQLQAFSTTQAVTDIVEALDRLEALDDVITDRLVEFVKDRYIAQNGGFGPAPGLGTTPPSTYQGLLCLEKLDALPERDSAQGAGPGAPSRATATASGRRSNASHVVDVTAVHDGSASCRRCAG